LNRFEREKNRTEINQFEPVFGSVKKLLKNNFGLVVYFGSKPDRTENAQPYAKPTNTSKKVGSGCPARPPILSLAGQPDPISLYCKY
jgi:hypothetical protein